MEDPNPFVPNTDPLPIPPIDNAHLLSADFFPHSFSSTAVDGGVYDGDVDFPFNVDLDFSLDDLAFADAFLLENPVSSLSDGSGNTKSEVLLNPNPNSDDSEVLLNPNPKCGDSEVFRNPNPNSGDSEVFRDTNIYDCPSPKANHGPISSEESNFGPGSGSCKSNSGGDSGNISDRDVSSGLSQNSKIKVEEAVEKSTNNSKKYVVSKRKKEFDHEVIDEVRISKVKKSSSSSMVEDVNLDSSNNGDYNDNDDEKRKARLIRNRESAQLSRQRRKQYVEELEDKVKSMHSTITELNGKISYVMAENASLRQQLTSGGGGGVGAAPPPPGMYPMGPMPYPWMPYSPYMVKPQGSHVPLVPIPRLKPQQPAPAPKVNKKTEGKTKKVASVSLLGLLFCMLFFGGLVPMVNVKYGEVQKGSVFTFDNEGKYSSSHGRILQQANSSDGFGSNGNSSESLVASLYVPRNNKLVKIDGNLIIHSVLASEKAKASQTTEGAKRSEETGLAIRHGSYPPYPTPEPGSNDWRHPHLDRNQNGRQKAIGSSSSSEFTPVGHDGKLQQWFREGLAGPMLSSGMCTEVFQFDISPTPGAIVPATSIANVTSKDRKNSTRTNKTRNRRILHEHAIPLDGHILDAKEKPTEHNDGLQGNKSSSSMVVSVLVDPREAGDGDGEGVIRSKTISRIFVVVLIDSVKYVTYSCMLPFTGSGNHLVTT